MAKNWISDLGIKMEFFVDAIDNNTKTKYEAWPERIFVIKNNEFVFVGGFGPGFLNFK